MKKTEERKGKEPRVMGKGEGLVEKGIGGGGGEETRAWKGGVSEEKGGKEIFFQLSLLFIKGSVGLIASLVLVRHATALQDQRVCSEEVILALAETA